MPAVDLRAARAARRARTPLVHCLTNTVVQTITANALLAAGAAPAMVDAPEEAGDFAEVASAVLVNVGTVHARTAEAMRRAARSAGAAGTPWVLDPVAHRHAVDPLAELGHHPGDLVAEGDRRPGRGEQPVEEVQLGAAHPGRCDVDQHVAWARPGPVDILNGERTTRPVETHGTHSCLPTPA